MSPKDTSAFETIATQAVAIPSGDATLRGTLFTPVGHIRAAVVLNGATGVDQGYYAAFAEWLAQSENCAVLIYDYDGYGASTAGRMRHSSATMATWGIRNQTDARRFLRDRFPDVEFWVIGHSLGALTLHLQPDLEHIDRIIAVASGPAFWHDHKMPFRLLTALFWYGHVPPLVAAMGYLPRWAGLGAALPRGVYWQWRRWCTSPDFFRRDIGTVLPEPSAVPIRARTKLVALADDPVIPPTSVWKLMENLPNAPKRQLVLDPRDHGLGTVGHIGAFARKNAVLWPQIIRDFTPFKKAIAPAV